MSILEIPLSNNETNYLIDVVLSGIEYKLRLLYNVRASFWSISIYEIDDTPIVEGVRLVINYPIFENIVNKKLPKGRLYLIDVSDTKIEALQDDLGTRCVLVYDDGIEDV
jgi:hypothetical protein